MDDIMEKLGDLLSDEESVRQLSELAQMIRADTDEKAGETEASGANADLGDIMKISGLLSSFTAKDSNTELLLALRPHLTEKRQVRVDKAIKLMKLISVWEQAKENGMLNDIL